MLIQNISRCSWFIWKSEKTVKPMPLECRPLSLVQWVFLSGNVPGVFHVAGLDPTFTALMHVKAVKRLSSFSGAMVGNLRNMLVF